MHEKAPQEELERAVVNGVNRRFYGKDVPDDVVEVMRLIVQLVGCMIIPSLVSALVIYGLVRKLVGGSTV